MKPTMARTLIGLAAAAVVIAGCGSAGHFRSNASGPPGGAAKMTMADGTVMDRDAMRSAGHRGAAGPSEAAAMICGTETHTAIAQILQLPAAPKSTATWANETYRCSYRLPAGRLVLSVKQSHDDAAARHYFAAARARYAPTETLYGLGAASFGNRSGVVVLVKDSDTLTVDATRLPAVLGAQHNKRYDFAYEIASDILGCWTGG